MKRCIFSFFLMVSGLLSVFAQGVVWNQRFQDYFDTYKDVAIDQMRQYKIPAIGAESQQPFWHQV